MGTPPPPPPTAAFCWRRLVGDLLKALPLESQYALMARVGQGTLLLLAVALLVTRYTIALQGLFFVYLSLAVLFTLTDFGFGYAVVQVGSHLVAVGHSSQRIAFIRQARVLGAGIAVASLLLIGTLGAMVLKGALAAPRAERMVFESWWALAIASAALQWANLELARVEGLCSAAVAWRTRLRQEWLGGAALLLALALDAGLWSLCVQALVRTGVAMQTVMQTRSPVSLPPLEPEELGAFSWHRDVWPFQWRLGCSAVAGYFIFQAFNPILLLLQGPASTGRFGLSLSIMNMLLMVTMAWPLSRSAHWTAWLSQGERRKASGDGIRTLRASSLLAAFLAGGIILALAMAQQLGLPLVQRMADLWTTALLLLLGWVHHVVACMAVLLRAQRQEPLLAVTLVGACLNALVVALAAHSDALWVVAASSLAVALLGLIYAISLYRHSFPVEGAL